MALVIRTWRSNENPDNDEYVLIEGRQAGFMSWLLTKLGVDNTTTLRVSGSTVYFEQGSLAGFTQRVIPISRMSSAFFGYTKQ